jgi:hypothetical protein
VRFSPGANNGSVITRYTALCVASNGGAARAKSRASPLLVIVLTVGKSYTCIVAATKARGTSLAPLASGRVTS